MFTLSYLEKIPNYDLINLKLITLSSSQRISHRNFLSCFLREFNNLILLTQLDHYKELKEQVRKKVAIMNQQLEKLQWEQRADKERLAFEKRRHGEVQVPWFVQS